MENNTEMNTNFPQQQKENTNLQKPAPTTEQAPAKETVGFWEFLGLIALFAVPVVGFIALIVFMFSPKRKSLKNYARAAMAWLGIRLVACILIISLILSIIGSILLPVINESLGLEFDSIQQVTSLVINIARRNYSGVLQQLNTNLIELLGEEYEPLLAELAKPEYNELLQQIANRDYTQILSDLETNKYPNLIIALGEEDYAELIEEVKAASVGEASDLFDQIHSLIPVF